MERADRNIAEMLETLRLTFNRERQQGIDEELFDLIAGFEALSQMEHRRRRERLSATGNSQGIRRAGFNAEQGMDQSWF